MIWPLCESIENQLDEDCGGIRNWTIDRVPEFQVSPELSEIRQIRGRRCIFTVPFYESLDENGAQLPGRRLVEFPPPDNWVHGQILQLA